MGVSIGFPTTALYESEVGLSMGLFGFSTVLNCKRCWGWCSSGLGGFAFDDTLRMTSRGGLGGGAGAGTGVASGVMTDCTAMGGATGGAGGAA